MKRTLLGLTVAAALAGAAGGAQAQQPTPEVYFEYCGVTVMVQCGVCVKQGTLTNCTRW